MKKFSRPSKERFDEIDKIVEELYEDMDIRNTPVDIFEIMRILAINLIPFSSLSDEIVNILQNAETDGLTVILRTHDNKMRFNVYYDDSKPIERQRFTLAHELGHIQLNHNFPIPSECTVPKPDKCLEIEANAFAQKFLAPLPLVYKQNLHGSREIAKCFHISLECAKNVLEKYTNAMGYPTVSLKIKRNPIIKLFEEGKNKTA